MSDFKVVTLAYKRVEGDLSTGTVSLMTPGSDPPELEILQSFESASFPAMMRTFAQALIDHPLAGGAVQRTDRPGLMQLTLRPDEVELFRRDPAEAIRQRMIPPQRVVVGIDRAKGPDRTVVTPMKGGQVLDAGYSTLIDCFGDVVYARFRVREGDLQREVECHCCGTWSGVESDKTYTCWYCNHQIPIENISYEAGFAGVSVKKLLEVGGEAFFLPRAWNNNKNWITRSELERRYNEYNKEKES